MDVNKILLDILIVLLAAKVAAELADRVNVPAVVGEIAAGVIIGPSVLGWVHSSQSLQTLAQLGVILLLLEVGLEMDLAELGSVGKAAILVAFAGVAVPMVTGAGAGLMLGMSGKEALFVGAALTATSVGITARVFGDLRALATVEAKTVLGAAVADDILGLVILTVVTRIVTEGSVSILGVLWIVVLAVGFVVLTTLIGVRIVPQAFAFVRRYSRSPGTLVAIALAFTLAVSELAHAAQLAPIVGAFVAGIALARSPVAGRVRSELGAGYTPTRAGVLPTDRHRRRRRPVCTTGSIRHRGGAPGDRRDRQAGLRHRTDRISRRPTAHRNRHDPPR